MWFCFFQEMKAIKRFILRDENHEKSSSFLLTVVSGKMPGGQVFDGNMKRAWDIYDLLGDLSLVETLQNKPKVILINTYQEGE